MSEVNIRAAAQPKSDQLNADDLTGTTMDITVTSVTAGNKEQPVIVSYVNDNGRPFKPCKSMIRVLMSAWGDKGPDWVGKSMRLYNDPTVKYGGVEVGGIRISHVSHIKNSIAMSLTSTRGKRKPYTVEVLATEQKPKASAPAQEVYPESLFTEKLPAMLDAIASGKMTVQQVIDRCNKTGTLSLEQIAQLSATTNNENEEETF